ncbi:hypothetical protein C2845_PM04G14020 [Panicum miliaceum]|uniref:Protein PLASTID REDOX INSENSITIVE 2, chloroplastic-like n=1 Tax=Panicum miliaceum TaxID=4540 RepID=A0A3L6QS87_PANMI|nr:hypothetical protein C2845_PM04G14020 [Panicum miliaceum]
MATRAWATATVALNPPLLTRSSCSRTLSASPARRSAAAGEVRVPPRQKLGETSKFREHMAWRLEQKKDDYFGEHVEEIVDICTQACFRGLVHLLFRTQLILGSFLENDHCGPGTLLVHPFLDMKGEIKERGLPGAPQAARAAIAWAEKNIDKDWKAWTGEY